MRTSPGAGKVRVLFLSYNGLLEPILTSQVIPYLKRLSERNFEFILLTFEKKEDLSRTGAEGLRRVKEELRADGIEWRFLRYHKYPAQFSTLFDLFVGALLVAYLIPAKRVQMVHVRGITPGIIMLALQKIFRVKLLFDMRGLLAEEYVGGGLWTERSMRFRLVKRAEARLLSVSDAVTVLTKKHLDYNRTLGYLKNRNIPMETIPCCVDLSRFHYSARDDDMRRTIGLDEGAFVLMYPGKIGTFYLSNEMLGFYKKMLNLLPRAVFLIVSGDDTASVMRTATEMGIGEDMVRVVPRVRFEEMPRYLRIADAGIFFINPYKKFGSSPIKLGEFLACGVPVVINPGVGDTEEIVRENRVGVVVRDFDEARYERGANELLALRGEGDGLKARCRDTARRYLSLEDGANKYYEIYKKILQN